MNGLDSVQKPAWRGWPARRPEPDETALSCSEIRHGQRFGVFDGLDGDAEVFALERRQRSASAVFRERAA